MRPCQVVSLLCILSLTGCPFGESDELVEPTDPAGAVECLEDSECVAIAEEELGRLGTPLRSSRVFESAVCTHLTQITDTTSVSGTACACELPDSGVLYIGPSGAGCYVHGRLGDCLFGDDDFSSCEIDETSQCTSLCDELEARYAADAARTHSGTIKHAVCEQGNCQNVLEIEGRCYTDRSYQTGRDYDCALSGPEIIAQHQRASTEPRGEVVNDPSWYSPDANGTVELSVATEYTGTKRGPLHFGTGAQLYSVSGSDEQRADVIDPLEGADDCGVRRDHNVGTAATINFKNIDSAVLIDGDAEIPYELLLGSGRDFFNYGVDLSDQGVSPRFRGKYGFRAEGGSFGERVSVHGITLPEALTIDALEHTSHLERGALQLTWSGRNDQLLRLHMYVSSQPRSDIAFTLECLMKDDGEFEIPSAVMEAVPDGIARMEFVREDRQLLRDGNKALLTIGRVNVLHEVAYGERCDREPVVEACKRYADKMQLVYAECDQVAPPLDELCPDYLTDACTVCPEYYECMSQANTCTNNQLTSRAGCSCPK